MGFTKIFKDTDPAQRRAGGNIIKFMVLMLVFTLVARGTSGVTLARVTLAAPTRSDIVEAISGTATVGTIGLIEKPAIHGLTIAEMLVGVGQEVRVGDAIGVFELEGVEELLIRETASLYTMRADMERLQRGETIDPSTLETAQRTLRRAQEDYTNTVRQGEEDIRTAREELENLLAAAEGQNNGSEPESTIFRNHRRALEDYENTVAQGLAEIAEAEAELIRVQSPTFEDTALQNAIRTYERASEDYENTVAQGLANIAEAQEYLDNLPRAGTTTDRTAVDNARRNRNRAQEDYDNTRQTNQNNISTAESNLHMAWAALSNAQFTGDEATIAAALAGVAQAEAALTTAQNAAETSARTATRILEDAQLAYNQAQQNLAGASQSDIERAENAVESARTQAENAYRTAARVLEDAEINLQTAQHNFDNRVQDAQDALEAAETRAADRQATAARQVEDAAYALHSDYTRTNSDIERAQSEVQNAINRAATNRRTAARQVEDVQTSLRNAEETHRTSIQQNIDTSAQNEIAASTLELDILAQEELVATLATLLENNGTMYAQTAGVISTALSVGDTTSHTPIITMQDTSGGFEATLQISAREAELLSVGSETVVTTGSGNMFFTPTTVAIVSAIAAPCENDMVQITLRLPDGNWNVGQRIDTEVILNRANYDFTLPISALRSDDAGYFVYVMEQYSTVLGLQNVLFRVNVNINAMDNHMVSVSGAVGRTTQVVVASNRAVSAGDRVRVES